MHEDFDDPTLRDRLNEAGDGDADLNDYMRVLEGVSDADLMRVLKTVYEQMKITEGREVAEKYMRSLIRVH